MSRCAVDGCERRSRVRGYCTLHYQRIKRHGDPLVASRTRNNDSGSAEYRVWEGMWQRCTNPNSDNFSRYGGRGISVCERWRDYRNFLNDMGRRPTIDHQLERNDNSKNYDPRNCRWATRKEQQSNMRSNRYVELHGQRVTLSQASKTLEVPYTTLWHRLKRGESLETNK